MANSRFFVSLAGGSFAREASMHLSAGDKALVINDFHMASDSRDDLEPNGDLVMRMLEDYYLPRGYTLILNGDVEELQRCSLESIRRKWRNLYRIFDAFAESGRFYKLLGNHDGDLIFEKDYPYPLYEALRIKTEGLPIFVYHGHQSSAVYTTFNRIVQGVLRYLVWPLGFKNITAPRSPHRHFHVEKEAYAFSLQNRCISIIGHTHRPLVESLGRFDFIKFEIERLCRDYPLSEQVEQQRIAGEVQALLGELGKLRRSERREGLRQSLYGDDMRVPCLFNSGSVISRRGITAIELDSTTIRLVYWFREGEERKFIRRGNYPIESLSPTPFRRTILNQDRLDFIQARIELLGPPAPTSGFHAKALRFRRALRDERLQLRPLGCRPTKRCMGIIGEETHAEARREESKFSCVLAALREKF
jgi:predicted phosphodiesterase